MVGRTISGENSRLGAGGLAHHDGSVRVVLLHGGVGAVDEGSGEVSGRPKSVMSHWASE